MSENNDVDLFALDASSEDNEQEELPVLSYQSPDISPKKLTLDDMKTNEDP